MSTLNGKVDVMHIVELDERVRVAKNNYIYEVLSESDKDLLYEAAECIADVFVGVQVGDVFIDEPIINVCNITKEIFLDFIVEYLGKIVNQGLSIIVRDKESGEVVGAFAAESYNPEEMIPLFKGKLEPWNKALELCDYLDKKFVKFLQLTTGKKVENDEHIHWFIGGIRLEKNKKYVFIEVAKLLERIGKKKGYKSIFAEITNFRIQNVMNLLNYTTPLDEEGNPIVFTYANDPVFKYIPENISLDCKLVYKWLE